LQRSDGTSSRQARREVVVFLALVLALSSGFYAFAWLADDAPRRWLSYSAGFMWCPGLAALPTRLTLRGSLRELGWRLGPLSSTPRATPAWRRSRP
jgi:hypothetical protein